MDSLSTSALDASLWAVLVLCARILPMAMALPFLGPGLASPGARIALACVLCTLVSSAAAGVLVAHTTLGSFLALSPFERALILARELWIGALIGAAAAIVFWGAHAAFLIVAHALVGHGSAAQDASATASTTTLGQLLAGAVFLAIDGHVVFLRAVAATYSSIPVALAMDRSPHETGAIDEAGNLAGDTAAHLVHISAHMVEIAAMLAAPVLVARAFAHTVLALLQRLESGLRTGSAGPTLALATGAAMLALALPTAAITLAAALRALPAWLRHLLE